MVIPFVSLLTARWLADIDKDNMLNLSEYILAKFLIYARENAITIPRPLPQSLLDSVSELGPSAAYAEFEEEEEEVAPLALWTVSPRCIITYRKLFSENKTNISGTVYRCTSVTFEGTDYLHANTAPAIFSRSGLDQHTLSKVRFLSFWKRRLTFCDRYGNLPI
jgi:hypothetical protein